MRKQKTFQGLCPMDYALRWLLDLNKCFLVKSVKIEQLRPKNDWQGNKVRARVVYE